MMIKKFITNTSLPPQVYTGIPPTSIAKKIVLLSHSA